MQNQFETFLQTTDAQDIRANIESVDLQYHDPVHGHILVEVKPCDAASARYAIRTAMGQLLDYQQRAKNKVSLLIVIEVKPNGQDALLATSNGFWIAYPCQDGFKLVRHE